MKTGYILFKDIPRFLKDANNNNFLKFIYYRNKRLIKRYGATEPHEAQRDPP